MRTWTRSIFIVPTLVGATLAAETGDKVKAEALVQDAATFGKANGREKLLREINLDQGRFHTKAPSTVYLVVYDAQGKVAAHGLDLKHLRMGHLTYPELKAMANEKPNGWHEYDIKDPMGGKNTTFGVAYATLNGDLITSTIRLQ